MFGMYGSRRFLKKFVVFLGICVGMLSMEYMRVLLFWKLWMLVKLEIVLKIILGNWDIIYKVDIIMRVGFKVLNIIRNI